MFSKRFAGQDLEIEEIEYRRRGLSSFRKLEDSKGFLNDLQVRCCLEKEKPHHPKMMG